MQTNDLFVFPEMSDFEVQYNKANFHDLSVSKTSIFKLRCYIKMFNDTLNEEIDMEGDLKLEQEWRYFLDTTLESIKEMKNQLGITQQIQSYYF